MNKILTCLLLFTLTLHCSSVQVPNKYDACEKITVGPGIEDFVLNAGLIYISSHERRGWKAPGDIFTFDLKSRLVKKLARSGEPADVFFSPHGVDIYDSGREKFLYVVNHGREMNDGDQSILVYRISAAGLTFVTRVRSEFINSPNDIAVTENGGFYVTNDHGSRGSLWEVFWGLRRSKVTYCAMSAIATDATATCTVATQGLAMANGILLKGDKVYVTATRDDAVFEFTRNADQTLGNKIKLAEVAGPDNLFWHDQHLITASHTSNWKFFRHASSAKNKAPSYIVSVNAGSKDLQGLYFSDGSEIGAASGAFIHDGKLYISQVFEDFMLECRMVR